MIECNGVRLNLHPCSKTLRELRDMMYGRGGYNVLTEEQKVEEIVDWFVNHGNNCFELGQRLNDRS